MRVAGFFSGSCFQWLFLLLLVTPLAVFPLMDDSGVQGKESFAQPMILACAVCALMVWSQSRLVVISLPPRRVLLAGGVGSIVAVLADSQVNFPLHLPATAVLFWFLAGTTVASATLTFAPAGRVGSAMARFWPARLVLCATALALAAAIVASCVGNVFLRRVQVYFPRGEMNQALMAFLTALQWDAHDQKSNLYAGAIYVAADRFDDGIPYLRRALASGSDVRAHLSLAQAVLAKGQHFAAIRHYEWAIHTNPYYAGLHSALAELYAQSNDLVKVQAHRERARQLEEEYRRTPESGVKLPAP